VPFYSDNKSSDKTKLLRRGDYQICSDINHYQPCWDSLNAVVICRELCSGLIRNTLESQRYRYRLLLLGELLKSTATNPSQRAKNIFHLKRHLTKHPLRAPQFSEGNVAELVGPKMRQSLSLPAEMKLMIADAVADSKAWATMINIEYIQPFLNAKQDAAQLISHMQLEHPLRRFSTVRDIKRSRWDFMGNSYIAIDDHEC
jgi:hypothetical protein